jgi:phosphoserine phosphatase
MAKQITHVLNVIAENADGLAEKFASFGEIAWLSGGRAFDVALTSDPTAVLAEARATVDVPADINVVALADRRKMLFVADMDSTIIACECLDEIADFAGLKARIAAITEKAMRGEIEFAGALRERVGLLKGMPLATLDRVWAERIRLTPGARELLATMKAHGARALLVSGGFTFFTAKVAAAAGFDEARANTLLDDGERLTGKVGEPILGQEAKLATLQAETARLGLSFAQTMAAGDGANDLAMIRRSGLGVAFHAKPKVAAAALARIDHNDLKSLLYLQGYRDGEIVTAPAVPSGGR